MQKKSPTSWSELAFSEKAISYLKNDGLGVFDLTEEGAGHEKELLEMYLQEYFSRAFSSLIKNEKKINTISEKIFQKIDTLPWMKTGTITSAEIDAAILVVTKKDGSRHSVNLMEVWQDVFVEPKKAKIREQTRKEERELQEVVAKQAFYNGSVVMEYVAGSAVAGTATIALAGGVGNMVHAAKSMIVTLEDGTKQRVTFKKPYVGTREAFSEGINRILSLSGLQFDFAKKTIYSPTRRLLKAAADDIKNLTFEKFSKNPDAPKMTEEQFDKWKKITINKQNSIFRQWESGKISSMEVAKMLRGEIAQFIVFFPLFAVEFHKNQTPYNLAQAMMEEFSFVAGAKLGAKLPWNAKPLWAIVGGLGAVFGTNAAMEFFEAKRKKWLYTQETNYKDGRSGILHAIFSLGVNEGLGRLNEAWRNFSSDKNAGGIDIGTKNLPVMLPIVNKKLFTIPEITFYQDKLTMATEPWAWIQENSNRDIYEWNRYVDMYKVQATKSIYSLLWKYMRNESIFADENVVNEAGGKKELLQQSLMTLLSGDNMGRVFENEQQNIITGIMTELQQNPKIPNPIIDDYIAKNIGAMKIDAVYIFERKRESAKQLQQLILTLDKIPKLSTNEKKYLQTIPEKMLKNEPLYQNDAEKTMYETILTRSDVATELENLTVWNAFALWLDSVVEWKKEKYFLNQLEKNNPKWIEWTL